MGSSTVSITSAARAAQRTRDGLNSSRISSAVVALNGPLCPFFASYAATARRTTGCSSGVKSMTVTLYGSGKRRPPGQAQSATDGNNGNLVNGWARTGMDHGRSVGPVFGEEATPFQCIAPARSSRALCPLLEGVLGRGVRDRFPDPSPRLTLLVYLVHGFQALPE